MARKSVKAAIDALDPLAVALSLIFVGWQVHQNTVATRAAAYQALGLHASSAPR